ncbi:hypothetical protein UT300003_32110 [Clostridium sardiniense]
MRKRVTKGQFIKGAIALTIGLGAFVGGFIAGQKTENKPHFQFAQTIKAEPVAKVEKVDFVKGTFTNNKKSPSGNEIIELTDGSYVYHNVKDDKWGFQPVEMGDWDICELDSNQAHQIAEDYIKHKNELRVDQIQNVKEKDHYQIGDNKLTIYTDGSYAIANPKTNQYDFYPCELDGWGYHTKNKDHHEKQLLTYLNIKNSGTC